MSVDLTAELRRFEEEIANVPKFIPAFIPSQVKKIASNNHNGVIQKSILKNSELQQQQKQQKLLQPPPLPSLQHKQPKVSTNSKSSMKMNMIPLEKSNIDLNHLTIDNDKKSKKLKKSKKSKNQEILNYKSSSLFSNGNIMSVKHKHEENKKKSAKNRKLLRVAGGTVWEDITLAEWPEDDYRIFCGDLGNDVTDELLVRHFGKYPSFLKAKVIRDRRSNKSKGYGFVSFKDPIDFSKAMKEMNGRYVGSRPIKLKKSCWKNRSIDVAKKREKERSNLISLLQSGLNKPIA